MDLSKYRQLYISETQENLDQLARRLVDLESTPDDREHIDTVFRLFHSIKGMSGTMGYTPLFELAHQLEEVMDRVRRRVLRMSPSLADVLLAGVDRMVRWLAAPEILYAGVVSGGIAFTIQAVAQRYTTSAQAAIFLSSEAVFASLFGIILLGESLPAIGYAGCALMLVAMLMVEVVPALRPRKTA